MCLMRDWTFPILGFVIGGMVGLTGIGGGSLMTPLLILVGGIRPVIAVGTDLLYGAITKAVGAFLHYRQETVDLNIVWHLGVGSIPAALLGAALIQWIKGGAENGTVDRFISRALGAVLILVALILLLRPLWRQTSSGPTGPSQHSGRQKWLTIGMGAGVGLLVGLTSVGSGALIAAFLGIVYPELPLRRVVGTDVFHATLLAATAGLAHLSLGTVDLTLLASLLMGSIPGVWLGSRLAITLPDKVLRPVLALTLLGVGYKLMGGSLWFLDFC
jgi:uncharacterized membrane protein YfcA